MKTMLPTQFWRLWMMAAMWCRVRLIGPSRKAIAPITMARFAASGSEGDSGFSKPPSQEGIFAGIMNSSRKYSPPTIAITLVMERVMSGVSPLRAFYLYCVKCSTIRCANGRSR